MKDLRANSLFRISRSFVMSFLFIFFTSSFACDKNVPQPNTNNVWFCVNNSDTVIVFVHGILSDSRSAWLYQGEDNSQTYWPDLVSTDVDTFNSPAIFLGGFYTELNSGDYSIRDAANELYRALATISPLANKRVLDYQNIIFIGHSTGGIAIRHILTKKTDQFKDKFIGLVLMASPSMGSKDADRFKWLAKLIKQQMGQDLAWNNTYLNNLHKDFLTLIDPGTSQPLSHFVGIEAIENHFIIKKWPFGYKTVVVEEDSGGRYFGEPQRLGNTDHFSIVKPDGLNHQSHRLLRFFYQQKYLPLISRATPIQQDGGNVTFSTPHEAIQSQALVQIEKDNVVYKTLPFEQKSSAPYGNYISSALIDNRSIMQRPFSIDASLTDQVIKFNDKPLVIGNVVDGQGRPISNVHVVIDENRATSTSDGRYVIDQIELKRHYKVQAYGQGGKFTKNDPWTGTLYNVNWDTEMRYNIELRRSN